MHISISPGKSPATSATIVWAPPAVEYQNGIITQYKISYMIYDLQVSERNPVVIFVNGSVTQNLISNLIPSQNYTVQIAASTTVGFGPYSLPEMYQTRNAGILIYNN